MSEAGRERAKTAAVAGMGAGVGTAGGATAGVLELASLGAASGVTAGLVILGGAAAGAAAAWGLYRLLKKLKSQPAK